MHSRGGGVLLLLLLLAPAAPHPAQQQAAAGGRRARRSGGSSGGAPVRLHVRRACVCSAKATVLLGVVGCTAVSSGRARYVHKPAPAAAAVHQTGTSFCHDSSLSN